MKKHPFLEDIFALVSASALISLGVFFLEQANLLSGGTAGISLVITHLSQFSFGQVFFIINLPFYFLAWKVMGMKFCFNTFVSVAVISLCADLLHHVMIIESIDPLYAAVIAGLLTGVGMLILFRHNSSLGGVGILAIFLNKMCKLPVGTTMLAADLAVFIAALLILDANRVIYSSLSAASVSAVLILNHKPYRYQLR